MRRSILAVAALCCLLPFAAHAAERPDNKPDQATLDKKFIDLLSGATLTGQYTTVGQKETGPMKEDKYTIESVTKGENGFFVLNARIQYKGNDTVFPLALPVTFVGDTPLIVINKFPIPGFGTFSARVLFDDGKYAGTWDAGDHGGHLFGRITKEKAKETDKQPESKSQK